MTPEEFLAIINALPDPDRAAYERDLIFFGRGYVEMTADGYYRRIDPRDVEQKAPICGPAQNGETGCDV